MTRTASLGEWPSEEIEAVHACPVCRGSKRTMVLQDIDDFFGVTPGCWAYYRCADCQSVYLDPRPTAESIGRAYEGYYTHDQHASLPHESLTGLLKWRRLLANGYKNWKFGTKFEPASRLGVLVAALLPRYRSILDRQFRHLPKRTGSVLDIGFGDGSFLENAQHMGWVAKGMDFDAVSVENARVRGLDVTVGPLSEMEGGFDVITMSHVIEHLYDPLEALRQCHRLLKPGGTLWMETPNANSVGLARLGRGWMAADAPRHLILFNRASLGRALQDAGFEGIIDLPIASPVYGLYALSPQIESRRFPDPSDKFPFMLRFEAVLVTVYEWLVPAKREFIALTARKPG